MKKILVLAVCALATAACSSSQAKDSSAVAAGQNSAIILDQEFENIQAPAGTDYSTDLSYEAQLRSSGTFVKGTKGKTSKITKTAKKTTGSK